MDFSFFHVWVSGFHTFVDENNFSLCLTPLLKLSSCSVGCLCVLYPGLCKL